MLKFEEWADSRTRALSVWDLALVKLSCVAGGILVARLVAVSRRIDTRVLAGIAIGLAVKPATTFLLGTTPRR